MNDSNKSPEQVNSFSERLLQKIEKISGKIPPNHAKFSFISIPIMQKLIKSLRRDAGRLLTIMISDWVDGQIIIEVKADQKESIEYLSKSLFINYNPDLELCTLNEEKVLSLLDYLFPEKRSK